MIDYNLAKQLKDAGFPQKWREGMSYYYNNGEELQEFGCEDHGNDTDSQYDDCAKVPNLSELIEACGDRLWSLTRHGDVWQTNFKNGMGGETASKNIETAVANLWLELNKK